MKRRNALRVVRSVTTDNGCEFLDQGRLDRVFRAEVYYTRAYASYEKGAIENCNGIVRRWHPKGTDFNSLTMTAGPAARRHHKHHTQTISERRDGLCLRFTSGPSGLRPFC